MAERDRRRSSPAQIYHLAGVPHVGDSWAAHPRNLRGQRARDPSPVRRAARAAAEAARAHHQLRDRVPAARPRDPRSRTRSVPNSPYGTSKLAQEMVARRAWEDDGIPALIARSFNHVGPRQSPSFVASSIAKQIAEIEAGRRHAGLHMGNLDAAARHHGRARHRARVSRDDGVGDSRACPTTSARARRWRFARWSSCCDRRRACRSRSSRIRRASGPNDTPLVLGDHCAADADTGWIAADHRSTQTVDDSARLLARAGHREPAFLPSLTGEQKAK